MEMVGWDARAYWGAIAQVIPVLALALVIEAKVTGQRLSKKKNFKKRGVRLYKAVLFYILAASVLAVESIALIRVASGKLSAEDFVVSIVVVLALLVTVVLGPLGAITDAVSSGMLAGKGRNFPLSRRSLLLRRLDRIHEVLKANTREARAFLLEVRGQRADLLVDASKLRRAHAHQDREKSLDAQVDVTLAEMDELDGQIVDHITRLATVLDVAASNEAEIERLRAELLEIGGEKDMAKFERKLRKRLRAVSS